MSFYSEKIRLSLFTDHIALKEMFKKLSKTEISEFLLKLNDYLKKLFKRDFNYYICCINPHCSEKGAMGNEEADIIIPALRDIENEINIKGIYPADTVFVKAMQDKNSYIVCWYHDQGLIGFKSLNFYNGVNLSLGLPFVRTSPDHGTAYDIVGKDIANPLSMMNSIKLAEELINS